MPWPSTKAIMSSLTVVRSSGMGDIGSSTNALYAVRELGASSGRRSYSDFFLALLVAGTTPRAVSGRFLNPRRWLSVIFVLARRDPFRRPSVSPTPLRSSLCLRCFPRWIFLRLDLLFSPYLLRRSRARLRRFFSSGFLTVLMWLLPAVK